METTINPRFSSLKPWFLALPTKALALTNFQFRLLVACLLAPFLLMATFTLGGINIIPVLVVASVLTILAPKMRAKAEKLPKIQNIMNITMAFISLLVMVSFAPGIIWPLQVAMNRGIILALVSISRLLTSKVDPQMAKMAKQMAAIKSIDLKAAKQAAIKAAPSTKPMTNTRKKHLAKLAKKAKK